MSKVCRFCLAACERDDVTIETTFSRWEEKTIWSVVSEILALKKLENDPLPKIVCVDCFMKLDQYYEFHQQILCSDKKLKDEYAGLPANEIKIKEENKSLLKLENPEISDDNEAQIEFSDNDDATDKLDDDIKPKIEEEKEVNLKNERAKADFKQNDVLKRRRNATLNRKKYKNPVKNKNNKPTQSGIREKKVRKCVQCNKTFNRKGCYDSHMIKHFGTPVFACEFCPKKFIRGVGLVYHRRTHTGEKPYSCSICSKTFKTPSELHAHRKTHSEEKSFKCTECDATFRSNECLKNHIRRHTGERPFLCEICSKGFVSKAMLGTHIKTAHNEKETCPICQKQITPLGLKKHLQRHRNQDEGIKNFTCELCGKGFSEAATRRKHMLIHTGEKPFACEVCGKRFTQKSTLTNHSRVHSDVLPFPCNFCEKGFRYKHHLRNHVTVHHKDLHLAECDNDSQEEGFNPFTKIDGLESEQTSY